MAIDRTQAAPLDLALHRHLDAPDGDDIAFEVMDPGDEASGRAGAPDAPGMPSQLEAVPGGQPAAVAEVAHRLGRYGASERHRGPPDGQGLRCCRRSASRASSACAATLRAILKAESGVTLPPAISRTLRMASA